jgi:hypothetical protein
MASGCSRFKVDTDGCAGLAFRSRSSSAASDRDSWAVRRVGIWTTTARAAIDKIRDRTTSSDPAFSAFLDRLS